MNLIKQYIAQSLAAASNNLRLTTYQLEVFALLRESILKSDDIAEDISVMKKLTPLSTLAIRLNEIYDYLTQSRVDFLNISEKFKEHSSYLIKDLNHLLETDNTIELKNAIKKLRNEEVVTTAGENGINVELPSTNVNSDELITAHQEDESENKVENETPSQKNNEAFRTYEEMILKPIKPLDNLIKQLNGSNVNYEDITKFVEIIKVNGEISERNGFEIISKMHEILAKALLMIKSRALMPGKNVIDSLRACLIVIVAVVKGKDVDITKYLNKAENFGKELISISNKETIS